MTAPTSNAELAYQVLDQIDAHPELHDQSWWFTITDCGTAGCFAGWSCTLSGDRLFPKGDLPLHLLPVGYELSYVERPEGVVEYVFPRAQQLLGLTKSQAQDLFAASNTREDLGRLVAEIFGPRQLHCGYTLPHPAHDWVMLANDERPADQDAHCAGGAA